MAIKKKGAKKPAPKKPAPKKPAPKKPVSKKAGQKKTSSSPKKRGTKNTVHVPSELKKMVIGVVVLVAVCLTGAMLADIFIRKPARPPETTRKAADSTAPQPDISTPEDMDTPPPVFEDISDLPPKKPQPGLMEKNGNPIVYEVFDGLEDIQKYPSAFSEQPEDDMVGMEEDIIRIALIIDDIGYDKKMASALHALEPNISFSVLPWSPFGKTISRMLAEKGAEIMLHLPMEPMEYPTVNPGPGALLTSMPPDVLIAQLEKNLKEVHGVSGVNNHMGSMFTTQANQMNQIFTILKKQDLFFIDSRTAKNSQCRASARLLQVRFAERDVFLDNVQEVAYISGQFEQLKKIARKYGAAIGIGHPYPATLETLKMELPKLKGEIEIIPASRMVRIPG